MFGRVLITLHKQPPDVFCKKAILKHFAYSQEITCVGVCLIQLPATLLKRDFNTGVFL